MENYIKSIGGGSSHARRKSDGSSLLIKHKPNVSMLMSQNDSYTGFINQNSPERSIMSA